jgi:hypothetical protein
MMRCFQGGRVGSIGVALFVFHPNSHPVRDFRDSWDSACIRAGLFEILKDENGNPIKDKRVRK